MLFECPRLHLDHKTAQMFSKVFYTTWKFHLNETRCSGKLSMYTLVLCRDLSTFHAARAILYFTHQLVFAIYISLSWNEAISNQLFIENHPYMIKGMGHSFKKFDWKAYWQQQEGKLISFWIVKRFRKTQRNSSEVYNSIIIWNLLINLLRKTL